MERGEEPINQMADAVSLAILGSEAVNGDESQGGALSDGGSASNRGCKSPFSVDMTIVDLNENWVNSIKERCQEEPKKLKASSTGVLCSIYRVPKCMREDDEKAYTPQLISIGPFHRGDERLQAMEEHKWRYLSAVLGREGDGCLERLLIAVKNSENRARECYSEKFELDELSSNSFVEMMLLDGVFLIEHFYRVYNVHNYRDDPIIKFEWLRLGVWTDVLMLENQIPFFILQHLYDLMNLSDSLFLMALSFLSGYLWNIELSNLENVPNIEFQHILHFLHSSIIPLPTDNSSTEGMEKMIQSASELQEAGIKFKKGKSDSFVDIKFDKGVIEIPPLLIAGNMNPLLLNLVAFEQCYLYCRPCFTAYTHFMDCLINTAKDVEILCKKGIIDNWLNSDGEVADLFNKIKTNATLYRGHHLHQVFKDTHEYYGKRGPRWRAALMRNHFDSPWTVLSLIAAIVLLLLTFTQTFFSSFPKFADG